VDVSKAAELYASRMSLRAVGVVMNRSAMAVCYALRKAGIPRRRCCNPNWVRDYPRVPVVMRLVRPGRDEAPVFISATALQAPTPSQARIFIPTASAGHAGISAIIISDGAGGG
jgi:hypothetical protein